MFNITYGRETEERFNKIYRKCIEDNCECVIHVLNKLPMQEFLEILVDVVDGIDTEITEDSVTIEYGFCDVVTIKVLSLSINGATIELKF
ncbi:MAG: hypothetical protein II388_04395 [Clostridia bacterium]|nr:hypothetical protein [Clostridia bacterium]